MDISRTCGVELARPDGCETLASPSGTPRSVIGHMPTARGNCITVAEDIAVAAAAAAAVEDASEVPTLLAADCAPLLTP